MVNTQLEWAIENDVKIELICNAGRFAITLSKGDIRSTFSLDNGIGFDLYQHLLLPAIESIRNEHTRNPEENQS